MKTRPILSFSLPLYLFLAIGSATLFSCSSVRPTTATTAERSNAGPRFLDGIRVNPGESISSRNKSYGYSERIPEAEKSNTEEGYELRNLSRSEAKLVDKYASLLEVPSRKVNNIDLISEIDDWYGTPYRYGGSSKRGVDCSAFSRTILNEVFNTAVPRTAQQQYDASDRIKKSQLKQGDLVFFHTTRGGNITHVGIYLQNNKFVHASTSSGVMISDLESSYWRRVYRGAGRVASRKGDLSSIN